MINSSGERSSLSYYLKEIGKINLLSKEEEIQLTQKLKTGDEEAKKRLVESNLRYVVLVAKKYQGNGILLSDLINEGNMGLMKAADMYDYNKGIEKGCNFLSYAVWWIKQSIQKALAQQSRLIRIPQNQHHHLTRIMRGIGEGLSFEEISKREKMPIKEVVYLIEVSKRCSLDSLAEDENLQYNIKDERYSPENIVDLGCSEVVSKIEKILSPRSANIIKLRFGFTNGKEYTLQEVGEKMGVTRERIRQLQDKALKKLREQYKNREEKL